MSKCIISKQQENRITLITWLKSIPALVLKGILSLGESIYQLVLLATYSANFANVDLTNGNKGLG
jgi:hypothetical protein